MDGQPQSQYKTFRIPGDLGPKLQEVLEVLGISSPDYFDPLVRPQIENDHAANLPAIKAMRQARAKAAKARADALEAVELGENGGG